MEQKKKRKKKKKNKASLFIPEHKDAHYIQAGACDKLPISEAMISPTLTPVLQIL